MGRQCWLWHGLLCKQWLEKFLEGCQLPLPRALQQGGEENRPAVVLLGALVVLQNHLITWHVQSGSVFILSPELLSEL